MRRPLLIALGAVTASVAVGTAVASAAGKGPRTSSKNTIQCAAFKKMPDGTWYVGEPTMFRIGTFKKTIFTHVSIGPHFFTFGGVDLYAVLERKCGAHTRSPTR
jgi:hypothetical protein